MEEHLLDGMHAILAMPSYGPVDPVCSVSVRVAIMSAARRGLAWEGDASPDRVGYAFSRNLIVQSVLDSDPPDDWGILWVDSDMKVNATDFAFLLASARTFNADFVTGAYHQRGGFYAPVFYHFVKEKNKFAPYEDYPDDSFIAIEGCGFGIVWTSMKTLRAMARCKEFRPDGGWFFDRRDANGFGEDLSFCWLAMKAGMQLYVNTGIKPGHQGDARYVYKEDWLKARKDLVVNDPDLPSRKPRPWGLKEKHEAK